MTSVLLSRVGPLQALRGRVAAMVADAQPMGMGKAM